MAFLGDACGAFFVYEWNSFFFQQKFADLLPFFLDSLFALCSLRLVEEDEEGASGGGGLRRKSGGGLVVVLAERINRRAFIGECKGGEMK